MKKAILTFTLVATGCFAAAGPGGFAAAQTGRVEAPGAIFGEPLRVGDTLVFPEGSLIPPWMTEAEAAYVRDHPLAQLPHFQPDHPRPSRVSGRVG